jgi:hypothetical protein
MAFAFILSGVLAAEESRIIRKGGLVVDAPVSKAFPLFTPEGELAWADGWKYRVIYPPEGIAQKDLLFSTVDARGREMIWRIVRFDPSHSVGYYVVTAGSHVQEVNVSLRERNDGRTDVSVEYIYTPFTEEGAAFVGAFTEESYEQRMKHWETAIDHYLKTGLMLRR